MTSTDERLQNMLEVWYIDLQQMMDDNAKNFEITEITLLKLKRINREISEELKEYDKETK